MARIFDLHGLVSLAINDDREQIFRHLDAQLDPYEPRIGPVPTHADIVLSPNTNMLSRSLSDVHGPAGDGRRTGSDGSCCYLLRGTSRFELPRVYPQDGQVSLSYDPSFPLWEALSELVRPLLQLGTLEHGAITVHGATVEVEGGGGLLVCGWSESGKTETALALAERGARFISDKWTILDRGGLLHAFPVSVGIRDWVLEYLPRMRAHLRTSQRARLRVARTARRPLPLLTRRPTRVGSALESQLDRAFTLASRLSLCQTEVAAIYGSSVDPGRTPPLRTLAMLTTVSTDEVTVRPAEAGWAAERLARSGAYERRTLYELDARVRYADANPGPSRLAAVRDRETERLRNLLDGVQVLEVMAPFPSDPRRVADALAQCC
jgi:hypothetical protein